MQLKAYTAESASGATITYVDRKRWLWAMSVLFPLLPLLGIGLHAATGNELWLLLPYVINFGLGPILDWILGEDANNPPEALALP